MSSSDPDLVDRAQRLMTFLARAQAMKTRAIKTVEQYRRDGSVIWWNELPDDNRMSKYDPIGDEGDEEAAELPLLACPRVPLPPAPDLPPELVDWIDGSVTDPRDEPCLRSVPKRSASDSTQRDDITAIKPDGGGRDEPDPVEPLLQASPDLEGHGVLPPTGVFQRWLESWRAWATLAKPMLPVKDLYDQLFDMHALAEGSSEEYELCVGIGLLTWQPDEEMTIRRHVLTAPLVSSLDERSGTISLTMDESVEGIRLELDMLDPSLITMASAVRRVEEEARGFAAHPLDEEAVRPILETLATALTATAGYVATADPIDASERPLITWAPAIILRKRLQTGLVRSFETIAHRIEQAGRVPAGLLPLVDPDSRPPVMSEATEGALIRTELDVLTPLPLNDVQLRILDRVDRHAQTLVQGPPGTGKTHTAAALLSHLLAQGKRVLVTAHTDRALVEVRDKLPRQIKPLAVSVIGSSRSDMSELKTAVETIARESSERDPEDGERVVSHALERIGQLRDERRLEIEALRAAREAEVVTHQLFGYAGTLADIARQVAADTAFCEWIEPLVATSVVAAAARDVTEPADLRTQVTNEEAVRWWMLLQEFGPNELAAEDDYEPVAEQLPDPDIVSGWLERRNEAQDALSTSRLNANHPVAVELQGLPAVDRDRAVQLIAQTVGELQHLASGTVPDISRAAADVRSGVGGIWTTRAERAEQALAAVDEALQHVPPGSQVSVQMDLGTAHALATSLLQDKASENLRTNPDGTLRTGLFTPGIVKQCAPLFAHVRINGVPPTSRPALKLLLAWLDAVRVLQKLDSVWSGPPRMHPSLHEHAAWHHHLVSQLRGALDSTRVMTEADRELARMGLSVPRWESPDLVRVYREAGLLVAARERLAESEKGLRGARARVGRLMDTSEGTGLELSTALDQGNPRRYAIALASVRAQDSRRQRERELRQLDAKLRDIVPGLATAASESRQDPAWDARLPRLTESLSWCAARAWLRLNARADGQAHQDRVNHIEEQLREQVAIMAAARAWNHAVAPDRLTGSARADLTQYSQLVRRLGKGTGKYAARQRAEIRRAMDRCRPAVPVWIMPIYRVAEQLDMVEDMFDVVLVDEASQAGLEATLLQYLAPRIVVIGDDKQVSPSAVGLDHNQLHRLADQYLFDDRYKSSWEDPRRSLFDEARMRFGGQLTLVEHRRCVPEIIEFSNQIAYEPDGVRLEPVRQLGSSRLAPFRLTHVPSASTRGNNINETEAQALVDQVVECVSDPDYDGRTIGVISLVGQAQAKYIEGLLAQRLTAQDWSRLQLRCGDAADFQGSERDVMFLSMVSVRSSDRRLGALTQESAVQRFNVAVSRARDQVWLFHSITAEELPNTEDLRHRLLTYAMSMADAAPQHIDAPNRVPQDELVAPFTDLFEQHVFNAIVEKGYLAEPHRVIAGYETSMVVVGTHSSVVVECEGSRWSGAAGFARDLRSQRELERCGWPIVRVRESSFVLDSDAALATLWRRLDDLHITPSAPEALREQLEAHVGAPGPGGFVVDKALADECTDGGDASASDSSTSALDAENPARANQSQEGPLAALPDERTSRRPVQMHEDEGRPSGTSPDFHLPAYREFQGTAVSLAYAERRQIAEGLRAIVAVEGPVTGRRLFTAYARSSGASRVGKDMARTLDDSVRTAVRGGILVCDNPLNSAHSVERTYRLVHQPVASPRLLGPRDLDEVPPSEIAAVMGMLLQRHGHMPDERLYRETIRALGRQSLTRPAHDLLRRIHLRLLN